MDFLVFLLILSLLTPRGCATSRPYWVVEVRPRGWPLCVRLPLLVVGSIAGALVLYTAACLL